MKALFHLRKHLLAVASSALLCGISFASAEERDLAGAAADKVDAVLVLDSSGSMLATDPLKLRVEGAKLFTQFLKSGDRLAIVSFAEGAKVVQELKGYTSDQQSAVSTEIAGIESTGQYTNLLDGIQVAKKILENNAREGANPAIIVMSDGKMDPAPQSGSAETLTQQLIDTVLPDLKKSGVKVYTLYFSDQADKDLLQEIAALSDGINWYTPTADKIHESFANLFLAVKKPQIVPLTKKGFKLDADVQEATFYINREGSEGEIALIQPNGTKINATSTDPSVKWFSGQKFEVVTVTAPPSGDWQITGVTSNDGFATVLTKVRLVTEWPTNVNAEEEVLLEARLYEDDKPISLPEMSDVIKYAYQITPTDKVSEPIVRDFLFDDGTHGDKVEKDGIFSAKIELQDPGEYKLRILARAPTFERNQQIPFRVKPPLLSLSVVSRDENGLDIGHGGGEEHAEHGENHEEHAAGAEEGGGEAEQGSSANDVLTVVVSDEVLNFKKVSVRLFAVDQTRQRYEVPLTQSKTSKTFYEAGALSLPHDGEYKLQATLSAENKRGQEIKSQSRALSYTRVTTEADQEAVQVVIKEKEKKESAPASPVIPIILMTILNLGAGAAIFTIQKKKKAAAGDDIPVFESIEEIQKAFGSLRSRVETTEVDLNNPVFSDDSYEIPKGWPGAGDTGAVAAPPRPDSPPQQEAPAPEAEGGA